MLEKKYKKRPTITEVMQDPWVCQGLSPQDINLVKKSRLSSSDEIEKLKFGTNSSPTTHAKLRRNSKLLQEMNEKEERSYLSDEGSFYLDNETISQNPEFDNPKPRAISLKTSKVDEIQHKPSKEKDIMDFMLENR